MIRYRHRQPGILVLTVGGLMLILLVALLILVEPHPVGIAVLMGVVICLILFPTLTVEVTEEDIRLKFGLGIIRKRFPLNKIGEVRGVRNRWYYGWGIRLLERGLLYNVSGLDAVEVEMKDGRRDRIGTDEPEKLLSEIKKALTAAN
ncbi:MAG: hypothetical protein JXB45_03525 [Candidatus Krumholzibacteriota bacterium]|nr:hypothetical protein [Candidatus Krumholzibacteriota bacterium]